MKEITAEKNLVAYCGLYCGACKKYLRGKCPGCRQNTKATWCKVRKCCMDNQFESCADCNQYDDIMACKKFNNFMTKIFGFIFKSETQTCIQRINEAGTEIFAQEMADKGLMAYKRGKN